MIRNALGLIETIGLAAAVEAADVAVKSANVKLIGYELAKGDGMTTVKIEGDVGAVKAAVESAKAAASLISKVYSTQVIPRPAQGLEQLIYSDETVGLEKEVQEQAAPVSGIPLSAPAQVITEVKEPKEPVSTPAEIPKAPEKPEEKKPAPEVQKEIKPEEAKPEEAKKDVPTDKKAPSKRTAKTPPKPSEDGKKEGE